MSIQRKKNQRDKRRALRVRAKFKNNKNGLMRVSIFKSLNHIYAQIIDDAAHNTIVSCSSLELKTLTGDKKSVAKSIGIELATRAKTKGIEAAYFDRGSFLYHGRVKELAEGLREGGLKI